MNSTLGDPIRVDDYTRRQLLRLGIERVSDALYYFPRSYQDRRNIPLISMLVPTQSQFATGAIEAVQEEIAKNRLSIIKVQIRDSSGRLELVFFNQAYLIKILKVGLWVVVSGKLDVQPFTGTRQFIVAELDVIRNESDRLSSVGCIVPIYGLTQGVYQSVVRSAIANILAKVDQHIPDHLPQTVRDRLNLMPLSQAIIELHRPSRPEMASAARQRIVFDEFLRFQMGMVEKRQVARREVSSVHLSGQNELTAAYINQLAYRLTDAQSRAIRELVSDVTSGYRMNRLLQGDVGSGKTDVIAVALLMAVGSGYQAAVMVPTEVLAEQHFRRFCGQLSAINVDVFLLKGGQRSKERRNVLEKLATGDPLVVVGTHALIEDAVVIPRLGMVVVDEQHRFGVVQRMKLQQKSTAPHCLYTTATPIPRSFMLSVFGELEKTIIDEMPPGRLPADTQYFPLSSQRDVWNLCRYQLQLGRQIYVVYPLVDESEKTDLQSAIQGFELLKGMFDDVEVGLVHGRMTGNDKNDRMTRFKQGVIKILVSTTVIEVGIDVPNASVMIIVNAERFGLSQLHQLRGRVGRGAYKSYCILLGEKTTKMARERINAMVTTHDGFKLAELDLKLRGPGEILGTKQSGLPEFKLGDLVNDEPLLHLAYRVARKIFEQDPELSASDHQPLAQWFRRYQSFSPEEVLN